MFDTISFLKDYHIPYSAEVDISYGWVNIQCVFCDDTKSHGGFNSNGYYHCWKCGGRSLQEVIQVLIGVDFIQARKIIKDYSNNYIVSKQSKNKKVKSVKKELRLPAGTTDMQKAHKEYLKSRNFDPDRVERLWGLKGTSYFGEYQRRIIAPIIFEGKMVSFQGRDITEKVEPRYKTCKKEEEVIHHKHILYGIDYLRSKKAILVEGITDVWRLGYGSLACFGTGYTEEQIHFLSKNIEELFILFDSEDQEALKKAEKLAWNLSVFLKNVELVKIEETDPAAMKQEDADYLRRQLLNY